MKKQPIFFCQFFLLIFCISIISNLNATPVKDKQEFYQIRIFHFKDSVQEKILDNYFQNALLPALHKAGFDKIGAFKAIANDTAADKQFYIFITGKSVEQLLNAWQQLDKDATYQIAAADFINVGYKNPGFTRIESILLKAFPLAPKMQLPGLKGNLNDRVYELRSYESVSEKIFKNKVQMFNQGGEITLFKRLDFNATFYSEVISGSHMPNLMYMTSFENKAARDEHWKTFGSDPEWKKLSAMPEYQNNVSHIDIVFLRPVAYSDF